MPEGGEKTEMTAAAAAAAAAPTEVGGKEGRKNRRKEEREQAAIRVEGLNYFLPPPLKLLLLLHTLRLLCYVRGRKNNQYWGNGIDTRSSESNTFGGRRGRYFQEKLI